MRAVTALTIAGSDSGGGAGIQADLKTFLDHGVFGMSAITAITAQNSRGVHRIDPIPVDGLRAQLRAVFEDFEIDAIKIGMLGSPDHVACVADVLEQLPKPPPVVLDPVMVASTGHRLLEPASEQLLHDRLAPLCTLMTPNLEEAVVFAGDADAEDWARTQPISVLLTGGDTTGDAIVDRLVQPGAQTHLWQHPRQGSRPFHGTGCTLSSAIAAHLAKGAPIPEACAQGVTYVQRLIAATIAKGSVGQGNPSLLHGLGA